MNGVLMAKFPLLEDGAVLSRITHVFDTGGHGKVNFQQFVAGMNVLVKGGVKQKVHFILDAHDRNRDGVLDASEFVEMMKDVQDDHDVVVEYVIDHAECMDLDHDGKVCCNIDLLLCI
jgi:Ca2+-binding EF-hand superfamily protein